MTIFYIWFISLFVSKEKRNSAVPDKSQFMKRIFFISLAFLLAGGLLTSCKKDKGNPPILPPYASMVIDFSNFTTFRKSAAVVPAFKGTENSTWEFAAGLAGIWNSLISSTITVPMAAFQAASAYKATYVSENNWQWSYNFTLDANSYKARIQGKTTTSTVTWKVYITDEGTGSFKDYLWIEGTSKSDGSGGQWIFRQGPSADVQLFQDDWTRSGDQVTSITFTYLKNDTNKGSYINYLLLYSGDFDSGYSIHFADGLYSDSDIEWNSVTNDGRLKCLDYLQDDNWYCWDTNKINKICD
jgi:hypothetical protein